MHLGPRTLLPSAGENPPVCPPCILDSLEILKPSSLPAGRGLAGLPPGEEGRQSVWERRPGARRALLGELVHVVHLQKEIELRDR